MAVSFVGQATGVDTATLPAHQAGDLILVFAYRGSSAITPTLPAGFTSINGGAGNSNAHLLAYKIATSNSEALGTWTNAESLNAHVYRGVDQTTPIGGSGFITNITDLTYAALTTAVTDGTSWIGLFGGIKTTSISTPTSTPPAGFTNRSYQAPTNQTQTSGHDSNGGLSSFSGASQPTGSFRFRSMSVELRAAASGPAPITGTLSVTEAGDTVSSAGKLAIAGSASITEASDSIVSAGLLPIAGTLSVTEASDAVSASGKLAIAAASSAADGADTLAASGTSAIAGVLAATEGGDTVAAAGRLAIAGSASLVEQSDTLSASGGTGAQPSNSGSLNITEASDTLASTGALKIAGAVAASEAGDSLAAAGSLMIRAAAAIAEDQDSLVATGALPIRGVATLADASDTLAASSTSQGSMVGVWMLKPLKVWNGSAWVPAKGKYWDGSSWVTF